MLSGFLDRLAAALDVPLVPHEDLGFGDAERLASFDGWVATAGGPAARNPLLDRADLLVLVLPEAPGTLRGLVRRTVRRLQAGPDPVDLTWLDTVPLTRPGLALLRVEGPEAVDRWLAGLA